MPEVDAPRAFLGLAATFGLAFALLTPPLQTPDEEHHLVRVYALSEGVVLPIQQGAVAGVWVPSSVAQMQQRMGGNDVSFRPDAKQDLDRLRAELRTELAPDQREFVAFTSFYSPLVYLPAALAVAVARALDAPPIAYVHPGRLLYLGCFCAVLYFALRRAPAHRWTLSATALLPSSLSQAAAISADGLTIAFAIAAVAELLRLLDRERPPLFARDFLPLAFWGALVGLAKPVYLPLVGLAACLPAARFASPRARVGGLALLGASALPLLLWALALSSYAFSPLREGADPGAQVANLLARPQDFLGALGRSLRYAWLLWLETFVGVLGYLDTRLPRALYVAVPLLLPCIALLDGGPRSPVVGVTRALFALAWLLLALVVLLAAYVGWNEVAHPVIWGVQGRYFVPAVPLLLCALHHPRPPGWSARLGALWTLAFGATLAVAVASVVSRYYLA